MRKNKLFLALLFIALGMVWLTGCAPANGTGTAAETEATPTAETPSRERPAIRVETMTVLPTTFSDRLQLTGTVKAWQDVTISSEVSGQVKSLRPLGRQVAQGTELAQFDDRLLRAAHNAAQTAYNLADDLYQRQATLHRDSIISTVEFENVRAQRDQARAMLDQAEKQLSDAQLLSPLAGRIEERFVETGEFVGPGTPIVRIVNTRRVKVLVGVPERYAQSVREGTPVEVAFGAYNGQTHQARVYFVGSLINSASRTFPIEIELPNASGQLKPEMVADVSVLHRNLNDVLVIPQTSILRDERGAGVFILETQENQPVVRYQFVELGSSFAGQVVVRNGLQANDQIVVNGQTKLTAGDRVEIVPPTVSPTAETGANLPQSQ